jgi:hypothetical protein
VRANKIPYFTGLCATHGVLVDECRVFATKRNGKMKISMGLCFCFAWLLSSFQAWSADCIPPSPGLVGWWPGENDTINFGGTNRGTLVNAGFGIAEVGYGFRFSGTNSYCLVPASPELDVGSGNGLTVEAWIDPAHPENQNPIVEWAWDTSYGVHFYVGTGGPGCLMANIAPASGGNSSLISDAGVVVANQFQHVAVTYDRASGIARLFRNGTIVKQAPLGSYIAQTRTDVFIGYRPATTQGGPLGFVGIVDEPAIYNRALSQSEIQAIYNAGSAGKCKAPVIVTQPRSQIGFWGKNIEFDVAAHGGPPLSYQWWGNGFALPGATNASVLLTNLQLTDAGSYQVVISNAYGSVTSNPAILTVNPAGVSLALYAGVTIEGVVGFTYGIQYTTNLSSPDSWRGIANVTLSLPTQLWLDTQPATHPVRYYRVVPGPISVP